MITPQSLEDRRLQELLEVLIEWINDELAQHRIIVKNIEEDLYDGQVLHKLIGNYKNYYYSSKVSKSVLIRQKL